MKRKVDDMWRGSEDIEEIKDAGSAVGSGTWPTSVEKQRLRLRRSREGGCKRIGGNR